MSEQEISYERDGDGNLVVMFDDGTRLGTFLKVNMGDHVGIGHMLELAAFYAEKGHNVPRIVGEFLGERQPPPPGFWARLFQRWA